MGQILSQPSALCFSSDIEDIKFSTEDENAELEVDVVCGSDRISLLAEIVYPDVDHTVSVVDVSSLVETFAKQYLQVRLECSLKDSQGTVSIDPVTVLYAMADVGESASSFTSSHFLTILDGTKITAMGRDERLYAYGATTVTIIADVKLSTGQYNTLSATLSATGTTGNVSQFDVSPANIKDVLQLDGTLLGYTIEAGDRTQQFQMIEDESLPAPSLIFTNSFGCQEFIHCIGKHQKSSNYTRTSARVKGMLRNFRIVEERQFKANTGWLNSAMADWADDLFRSTEVYLWADSMTGKEVVITDSKSEISNEDDDMPAFEFTYVYAQRIHNVRQPSHAGRVFDNTFDHTFR